MKVNIEKVKIQGNICVFGDSIVWGLGIKKRPDGSID